MAQAGLGERFLQHAELLAQFVRHLPRDDHQGFGRVESLQATRQSSAVKITGHDLVCHQKLNRLVSGNLEGFFARRCFVYQPTGIAQPVSQEPADRAFVIDDERCPLSRVNHRLKHLRREDHADPGSCPGNSSLPRECVDSGASTFRLLSDVRLT